MAYERLTCPTCSYALIPPTSKAVGMPCPRCNSWVDIDSRCSGSCLSCHKTAEHNAATACTTAAEIMVKLEQTARPGAPAEAGTDTIRAGAGEDNQTKRGKKDWRRLLKRLFAVR